jgi:hypothetical protein
LCRVTDAATVSNNDRAGRFERGYSPPWLIAALDEGANCPASSMSSGLCFASRSVPSASPGLF